MNLSLYTVTAFLIIDTDGHRVLAKYYHPKGHPNGESKKLTTLKEQRAFEKGLFQKTKKAGGASTTRIYPAALCSLHSSACNVTLYARPPPDSAELRM